MTTALGGEGVTAGGRRRGSAVGWDDGAFPLASSL
jgi:hypothetical protein